MVKSRKFKESIVAFMDILGSKDILLDEKKSQDYLDSLYGFYNQIRESFSSFFIKTFSDNVIIYSDDCSKEGALSIIRLVAEFQYLVLCKYGLMIRGGISIGSLYWDDERVSDFIIGPALAKSYEIESEKAIYSRVVLDRTVEEILEDSYDEIIRTKGVSFVNYLSAILTDGFPDTQMINRHADALKAHVLADNNSEDKRNGHTWDRIRSKDAWAFSYHNQFCIEYDAPIINFTEKYDLENDRVIIDFENEVKNDEIQ